MANFLGYLFWGLPVLILAAEIVATVYLSQKQVKRRRLMVIGSYLFFVAMAVAFALLHLGQDEFGYGLIPAILITAPWYFIPGFGSPFFPVEMLLGIILNCAVFLVVDQLSYPNRFAKLQGQDATYRSQS
jgi:hypothetical protein